MTKYITPSIAYVGVDDLDKPLFENQYPIPDGMSYNSYAIIDRDIAVTDTVEAGKFGLWAEAVEEATGRREPRYLIVHHMEPDHSACIAEALRRWPSTTVVASAKAIDMLGHFFPEFDFAGRTHAVGEGDTLSLGEHSLTFHSAPMVHWPEVMVSYDAKEQVLFSADAFGKFGALQRERGEWTAEARRYYYNIVGKYGPQVQALLRKLDGPVIRLIAPLHGPVLGPDFSRELKLYDMWSRYVPEADAVLVAYASIYGGTRRAALRLAEMLHERGVEATAIDLTQTDMSEAVSEAFRHSALAVAAPTYDAGIYPVMHDFLHHLAIKGFRSRAAAVVENGSWAPIAGKLMTEMLSGCRDISIVAPTVTVRSRLDATSEQALAATADALAEAVKKK